ncbi:MAG: ParM/StbA family protein [Oscillospiraceae bacterium]|jgi:plasmid segregation protein ParM|nr:ParM/StbA family protein [Oscillospiraceae bacterium]
MPKIIAIDHGNAIIKTPLHTFPAGLADAHGIADEIVEYRGRQYALSHRRLPYMRDKSLAEDYFILTLFALGRELSGLEERIVLAIGLPPAHMRAGRKAFEVYFASRSPIEFRYNKCPRIVHIEQVLCFPQAYAAAMTRAGELAGLPRAFVIDIGGMTVDTLLLRNAKPDMAYTMSLEGGVNRLFNEISGTLSGDLGIRAEQDQIEAALRGEDTLFDFSASHLMKTMAERFVTRLLRDLRKRDIDLQTTPSVFIGGGALLLRRFLEASPMVKAPIFIEEVNANALGYQLLAEAALRR